MKTKRDLSLKQQKIISIASFCLLLLTLVLLCALIGSPMVRFASDPDKFRQWVDSHGVWGMLAYMGMVALQVLAALIPGEPLEIASAALFLASNEPRCRYGTESLVDGGVRHLKKGAKARSW